MVSKENIKEYLSLSALAVVYLLCSVRYYPASLQDTLLATAEHIATIGPFTLGATLVIASVLRKMAGERLPWKNVLRIFLACSIILELILGIADYVEPKKTATAFLAFIV